MVLKGFLDREGMLQMQRDFTLHWLVSYITVTVLLLLMVKLKLTQAPEKLNVYFLLHLQLSFSITSQLSANKKSLDDSLLCHSPPASKVPAVEYPTIKSVPFRQCSG